MLFYSRTSLAIHAHSVSAQSCSRSAAESSFLLERQFCRWDGEWLKLVHVLAHVGFYSFRNTFSICCLGIVQTLPTSHTAARRDGFLNLLYTESNRCLRSKPSSTRHAKITRSLQLGPVFVNTAPSSSQVPSTDRDLSNTTKVVRRSSRTRPSKPACNNCGDNTLGNLPTAGKPSLGAVT